jgi:hypothetical protein
MGTPVNYLIPGERAEDVGGHEVGAAVPAGDPDGLHVVGVEHGEERVGDDVLQRLPPPWLNCASPPLVKLNAAKRGRYEHMSMLVALWYPLSDSSYGYPGLRNKRRRESSSCAPGSLLSQLNTERSSTLDMA